MKRLGLILLVLPLISAAEVVVPVDKVENNINIRMSADAKAEIVGRLNQGDWLTLVESVPGWHEVEIAGGATGFISADWSKVLEAPPSVDVQPPVEVSEAEESVPEPDAEAAPVDEHALVEQVDETVAVEATVAAEEPVEEVLPVEETAAPVDVPEEVIADIPAPVEVPDEPPEDAEAVAVADVPDAISPAAQGEPGPQGPVGPAGPAGPPGPTGAGSVEGTVDYLVKFTAPTIGGNSQLFDDGNNVGIGTTEPTQRLEVNGNIRINEQNSSVAGLMITQAGGETGYIMHNRASTLTIGAGSIDRITIDREGNVGFGVNRPSNPIEMANGAHVTAGGVWTNSSSRARKENIAALSADEAAQTLAALEPVQFNYKNDRAESYVGFIAEDVPELVATSDRDGLSAMDIVAVLTRVVQEQQKKIAELEARLDRR